MIIKFPVVEKLGGELISLGFSISPAFWEEIKKTGSFNFNANLFETLLPPASNGEIFLSLLGNVALLQGKTDLQELEINDANWQILYCRINDKQYNSFYSTLNWNDLSNTFTNSIISFASKKVAGNYAGEMIPAAALEMLISKMVTGVQQGVPDDPSAVASIAADLMKSFIGSGSGPALSVREQVQEYLESQSIPIDFSEQSFYFKVDYDNKSWSAEINLVQDESVIAIYSSIPLNEGTKGLAALLESLNDLNMTIAYGNYEYSPTVKRLYFKNALPIMGNRVLPAYLDELIGHNFKQMSGMLAIIDRVAPQ